MTQGRDFETPSKTPTVEEIKERESLADAIEEVFKLWVESKDGVVTRRTIDAIAEKRKVNSNLLEFAWQDFLSAVVASSCRRKGI
ncbi:MAG: hypothetical protein ABSB29_03895 [Nitrososphaerales archaeon]|jgi:hypothetical protein